MLEPIPFLNLKTVFRILHEFEWPEPFTLEDEMPDGIVMSFPKSNFVFTEAPDGEVIVKFLCADLGCDESLHLGHALSVLVPESERIEGVATPELDEKTLPFPSKEKTEIGIRNACMIILTHMTKVIKGDFSWVQEFHNNQRVC